MGGGGGRAPQQQLREVSSTAPALAGSSRSALSGGLRMEVLIKTPPPLCPRHPPPAPSPSPPSLRSHSACWDGQQVSADGRRILMRTRGDDTKRGRYLHPNLRRTGRGFTCVWAWLT